MLDFEQKKEYKFADLVKIISILRAPDGCPWDAQQTHESIKKNLIEETYEVIEAINKADADMLREELGDLLMQVVFHADMASDDGKFDIDDVADEVCKKLIVRHPHIFSDIPVGGVDDVLTNWEDIKKKTKGHSSANQSMRSVARELPALMRASKVQKRAADVGFDWPNASHALEKLEEEVGELKNALKQNSSQSVMEELGDVLFSAVNVTRLYDLDAEEMLTMATEKFIRRFTLVEEKAMESNLKLKNLTLDDLNLLWDEAKKTEE
ncbi:MAG: nucleoside triphosphate pyrophosphohydrolase [Clostridiales bacterium]|nr:nucleoside triphosphate pyrophosphohydrolase [Clostridiales bacterium]